MKIFLTVIILFVISCGSVFAIPRGAYFMEVIEPVSASSIESSSKRVDRSVYSILGLFAFGDASIQNVAVNAGIKQIKHIDKNTLSILGLFVQETYSIYGN